MLAGVEQDLVLGDDVSLGVLRLGSQHVHARKRAEIDLDVERRPVLGDRRLGVEIEDDAIDARTRQQRVEALEAGVQVAGGSHQPDRGVLAAHRLGRLLEQPHGLAVEVALDLGHLLHVGNPDVLLAQEHRLRRQVFELEHQRVVARPQVTLERHRDGGIARAVLREAELVAEGLEQLSVEHDLAGELEIVRAESGEVVDGGGRARDLQHRLHHGAALHPAQILDRHLGVEGGRSPGKPRR